MKLGGIRKSLLAAFPLAALIGKYFGFEVTPEWWEGLIAVATPIAVFWFANDKDKAI